MIKTPKHSVFVLAIIKNHYIIIIFQCVTYNTFLGKLIRGLGNVTCGFPVCSDKIRRLLWGLKTDLAQIQQSNPSKQTTIHLNCTMCKPMTSAQLTHWTRVSARFKKHDFDTLLCSKVENELRETVWGNEIQAQRARARRDKGSMGVLVLPLSLNNPGLIYNNRI